MFPLKKKSPSFHITLSEPSLIETESNMAFIGDFKDKAEESFYHFYLLESLCSRFLIGTKLAVDTFSLTYEHHT